MQRCRALASFNKVSWVKSPAKNRHLRTDCLRLDSAPMKTPPGRKALAMLPSKVNISGLGQVLDDIEQRDQTVTSSA